MTVGDFEHRNAARWAEFEALVTAFEKGKPNEMADQLPRRFREICLDLSLAEARRACERSFELRQTHLVPPHVEHWAQRHPELARIAAILSPSWPETLPLGAATRPPAAVRGRTHRGQRRQSAPRAA